MIRHNQKLPGTITKVPGSVFLCNRKFRGIPCHIKKALTCPKMRIRVKMQMVVSDHAGRPDVPRRIFTYIMYRKEDTGGWF